MAAEVLAILRLACTLRLDARRIVGRDATILLLGSIAAAVWTLLDWLKADAPVRPEPAGLQGVAVFACAVIAMAWGMARAATPQLSLRKTAWLLAGYLPAAAAAAGLLTAQLSRPKLVAVAVAFGLHAGAYFYCGLRAIGDRHPYRAFCAWVAGVALLSLLLVQVEPQSSVWRPHLTETQLAQIRESERRAESLLYAQSERIDVALAAIPVATGPDPSVFFVGFAGHGDQRVFAQEIALAERQFQRRYRASDQSLLLINDRRDFDGYPLASGSALERVLNGIAERMDQERDVLFLALSSHGRKDPHLVVTNGSLPLDSLTPESLAGMLERSGIRWRVLVISACYAGAFIERLRNENTIVIAAAAPDKTSFGCNDRRELTNFGEAFYRDALPSAASLRAAFETAAANIAARERREGLVPSQPQAHFGAAMERKLAELEARRAVIATAARSRP